MCGLLIRDLYCNIQSYREAFVSLPRAYAAGLSDWFCLSVRPSVRPSVHLLSVHSKIGLSRDLQG